MQGDQGRDVINADCLASGAAARSPAAAAAVHATLLPSLFQSNTAHPNALTAPARQM
jgi:hypothetical protein